ncbi:MAG: two-component system response regulator KdpE [Candidatus Dactylopiibacterium carminicum]|uniref:Two-component system response regulator KdpE n=1 Tax=Candidatus Dactylopiibacterium carminicum TaxID=857335 RepID=A0A272EQX9_9RHOO|nr:response regulator [Candidatus Dactylopiibacterium carminicum]KAF7598691.1 two-component system response regulator KdpE [Candidatus Dactylopiibacterium carminicum]PAS92508.1 MAG: two-component system response regulator KdpE [Candidatus Dactylopiibacterium carminicum]PAS98558.1 MAG: two-component system response regulator KdpE [Candidatus Dactylopiibacterium carminicum]
MNDQATVLIVEDDPHIRRFVGRALREAGYEVAEADRVIRGLVEAASRRPSVVILDLGLPDMDGKEFVRELRQWSDIPILVLSVRASEQDKIDALTTGADDYLTKPFGVGELVARIKALERRHSGYQADKGTTYAFGDISVDLLKREVLKAGEPVHLTSTEYRLLCYLLANNGKVLTHTQLLLHVWGQAYAERNHYTRVFVGRLRQKLEDDPAQPRFILTEAGVGYRFRH